MVSATRLAKLFSILFAVSAGTFVEAQTQCTDVHVVFARGSTEDPGLGTIGTALLSGIKSSLNGMSVSSYAVSYGAEITQTSAGPGATDMTKHIVEIAAQCPKTAFVIGGYSQGGTVTSISIGIKTSLGTGQTIPADLAPRIKAVVVFGNPLKLFGDSIASASPAYGSKAIEYCNSGDPVCGAGLSMKAHRTYTSNGSVAKAAERAAALVKSDSKRSATDNPSKESTATPSSPPAGNSGGIADRISSFFGLPSFNFGSLRGTRSRR